MAQLALGVGMAHSTMIVLEDTLWPAWAEFDKRSSLLIDTRGQPVSYEQLVEQVGDRFAQQATPEVWKGQYAGARKAIARLAAEVAEEHLDVLVIIGDDQLELFSYENMPALSIFYGEHIISGVLSIREGGNKELLQAMANGYAMDAHHEFASSPAFARALLESLIDQGFDVGGHKETPTTGRSGGLGHAYGAIVVNLLENKPIPIVPVLINTYYPPSQPTPSRCYDLGRALRRAIEEYPADLRVGIVASGGLSHFVTDEELDRKVLTALRERSEEQLRTLPRHLLNSGNSEIRNWITVAAACEHQKLAWDEYIPVYRTLAGTGCGLAFARWS
ncbi:MAG: extradiol ring-cleavage dioxygenase [Chloroflexi bacterium]|nr:extradiol ring-cleavage dioxygenase [Chloroflexota bacterium]